jgi:hypothetical protein
VTARPPEATDAGDERFALKQLPLALQSIFLGSGDDLGPLLADVPAVLYECNEKLKFTRITSNARQLLGVDPQGLLGKDNFWRERLFPSDRESLIPLLHGLNCGQTGSATHRIFDQRGLPVWVSHSFRKAATAKGQMFRGCIISVPKESCTHDIESTIIPEFVHKLGNHFQLINLLVGNMRRNEMPAADIKALQQALDETVEFTRTFLNYAQGPSCNTEFDISEIIKAVIPVMLPIFAEKKIALNNLLDVYFTGAWLVGDPFMLETAFSAVLQNSLDATNAGGHVSVTGRLERHQSSGELSARIAVSDSGCGMERDVVSRAIEPFFSSRRGRSGLGLSMASRIIEQHGGLLQITSVAGQGTQVHITLPVITSSETPDR